jgi:hypothetical protein
MSRVDELLQNALKPSGFIRQPGTKGIELPQPGHDALEAMADLRPYRQASMRKNGDRRYSKDQLNHEHFGELRCSGAVLDLRDLAIALVPDHISQFSLSKTETAPKNSHQVPIAWWLILHIRVVMSF